MQYEKFNAQDAMWCKKEGFTGTLLEEIYQDVAIEPLQQAVID